MQEPVHAIAHDCHVTVREVAARGSDGARIRLDRSHGDGACRERTGEQANAAVEVEASVAGAWCGEVENSICQDVGRTDVHLPEATDRDEPVAADGVLRDRLVPNADRERPFTGGADVERDFGTSRPFTRDEIRDSRGGHRDQAVVDRFDDVRSPVAQPGPSGRVDGEAHAGAPMQAVRRGRQGFDRDVPVELRQPLQLLCDDSGLEPALCVDGNVLPVAAAASAGSGPRTRRQDAIRRRSDDLDGVSADVGASFLGDLDANLLPRQCVPDEDHSTVRRVRNAHTAVRRPFDVEDHAESGISSRPSLDRSW